MTAWFPSRRWPGGELNRDGMRLPIWIVGSITKWVVMLVMVDCSGGEGSPTRLEVQ